MPESDRLTEYNGWIELAFVEREAAPVPLMKLIKRYCRYGGDTDRDGQSSL